MIKVIKNDIISAGIDKRVKGILEPKIGVQAYTITKSLLVGYIKSVLNWSKDKDIKLE